jgi:hypothetical protein
MAKYIKINGPMFIITGVDRTGRRFKMTSNNEIQAMGINLWKGSVWKVIPGAIRKLLKRV